MSPTKRCLVCPNTSRNNPKMIFVQMPHPKKEARSRRAWFAVYADILDYNDQLDCHLCSDHFDLENDASNLEYYIAKRMKKLLFKPQALPRPLPIIATESPMVYKHSSQIIKQEPQEYQDYEDDEDQEQLPDTDTDTDTYRDHVPLSVKEESFDIDENEIRNEPIDIKLEPLEEDQDVSGPSPPPLLPAATLANKQVAVQGTQQQQQPLVINSFQIANQQLRSQLLRLAAQGRLRVVNVSNVDNPADTTPTLAVLGGNDLSVNTVAGVIQSVPPAMAVRLQTSAPGPPQLVRKPVQVQQQQPLVRHMMVAQNQMGQRLQFVNVQQAGLPVGQVMNIRPISSANVTSQIIPVQTTVESPCNTSTILRHPFVLSNGAMLIPSTATSVAPVTTPSLVPLPMRSVYACGKCTELFYTTEDRDRHIQNKHPGSLFVGTNASNIRLGGGKHTKAKILVKVSGDVRDGEKLYKCEICDTSVPFSQKLAHLGTHETFKCVTCHQTLEKRIYAAHMMSHIEERPNINNKSTRFSKRHRNPRTYTNIKRNSAVEQESTLLQRLPKLTPKIVNRSPIAKDVTIYKVRQGSLNHKNDRDDVEKNLSECMISRDCKQNNKLFTITTGSDSELSDSGTGMDLYYLYNCKICRRTFRTKAALAIHQETDHEGAMTLIKCDYCLEDVIRPKMKHHIQLMHPDKIYLCPHCQAAFSHHHSYNRHLRVAHKDVNHMVSAHARIDQNQMKRSRRKVAQLSTTSSEHSAAISQSVDDVNMDYDEDYPLAMLLRQSNDRTVDSSAAIIQETDIEISGIDEMDGTDDELDDSPDYVDIAQYKDMV